MLQAWFNVLKSVVMPPLVGGIFLLHALAFPVWADTQASVAVIASRDVPRLSVAEVQNLFRLQKQLVPGNKRVTLFALQAEHPAARLFAERLYDIQAYQLQRVWDRAVYSGRARAPQVYPSQAQLIHDVAKERNAVGYVVADHELLSQYAGDINVIAIF